MSTLQARYETVKALYRKAKQEHVFKFWDRLTEAEKEQLLGQLEELDVERVNGIYTTAIKADEEARAATGHEDIQPVCSRGRPPAAASEEILKNLQRTAV